MPSTHEKEIRFLGFVPAGNGWDVHGPCILSIGLTKSDVKELIRFIHEAKKQAGDKLGYMGSVYRSFKGHWRSIPSSPADLGLSSETPWVVEPEKSAFIGSLLRAKDNTHVRWDTPDGISWAATLLDGRTVQTLQMDEDFLLDQVYSVLERLAQIEPEDDATSVPSKPGAYVLTLPVDGKEVEIAAMVHYPTPNSKELYVLLGEDPNPYALSQIKAAAKWRRL